MIEREFLPNAKIITDADTEILLEAATKSPDLIISDGLCNLGYRKAILLQKSGRLLHSDLKQPIGKSNALHRLKN